MSRWPAASFASRASFTAARPGPILATPWVLRIHCTASSRVSTSVSVTAWMRPVALGAVVQNLLVAKSVERARRQRRVALVLGAVTLGLDDEHRRPRPTEGAHVGQPVGERLVAKREAAMGVELLRLRLGRPHERENRTGLQEQRMRAVIDVLPAEIPDLQRHRRIGLAARAARS